MTSKKTDTPLLPFVHLKKPLRIAVIGLGSMGQRYAKILSNHPETVIYGCDPRGDKDELFNPQTGWQYLSLEKLVKDVAPTFAVISVPASAHLEVLQTLMTCSSLSAVLMEKPISDRRLSDHDFQYLFARAQEVLIAVGYNWRFHPLSKELWKVRDGIRNLTLHVEQDMNSWPGNTYCDPLREFSHEIDLVQYLTTNPSVTNAQRWHSSELLYRLTGIHSQGKWCVEIHPTSHQSVRWIKVEMMDGVTVQRDWNQDPDVIEATYYEEVRQLTETYLYNGSSEDLTCPLTDALQTTQLIDKAEILGGFNP